MTTTDWVIGILNEKPHIAGIEKLLPNVIRVNRDSKPSFLAGIISVSTVTLQEIEQFFEPPFRVGIIINVPKASIWTGDAILRTEFEKIAWGGIRDLLSAVIYDDDVTSHRKKEYEFVERILMQHTRVKGLTRLYDRLYLVHRFNLPDTKIAIINAYEATADVVRTTQKLYGPFDHIFNTNPNGGSTRDAKTAIESMGSDFIHSAATILKRLNKL